MLEKFKKFFKECREMIWPLLEPLEERPVHQIEENGSSLCEDDIDLMLEYVNKFYQSEEDRKKQVESKSIIFIGTLGVAATVLINLTKDLLFNNTVIQTPFRFFLVFIMTLAVIYLCRAIWFSIKALERRNYYALGFPKFMLENNKDKKKKLIARLYNYAKKNSNEINLKVDYMTMAQEYFKRAIIVVALFSSVMLCNYIFNYKTLCQDLINKLASLSFNNYLLFAIFSLLFVLILSNLVLFGKLKKLNQIISSNNKT